MATPKVINTLIVISIALLITTLVLMSNESQYFRLSAMVTGVVLITAYVLAIIYFFK